MFRIATVLCHPVIPDVSEKVCKYMNMGNGFFDWKNIFNDLLSFSENNKIKLKNIPPKFDFFTK